MAQENILFSELFLKEALVAEEGGLTALELFTNALKGKVLSESTLGRFTPLINGKAVKWDAKVVQGDKLQVLPQIAGGN